MGFGLRLMAVGGLMVSGLGMARGQAMPAALAGSWRIAKVMATDRKACWDETRAKELVGSRLVYGQGQMTWKGGTVAVPEALTRTLSRRKYEEQYKVDLGELGIAAATVVEIDLQHEDADVTGYTTEVPGDTVLLAGPGRIVVSACGVYYAAVRVGR